MSIPKTMDTLKAILANLGIPEESLHQDTLLRDNLQLDSVETVQISLELKRRLGVNVRLETRRDITLAEVCNLVEAAMSASH
ncbi:acyl carrier protein [Argonema antarcticum]|uniref:acyl carrier protein n=1 Tax=Argonema antarcticum TaxID=2942763 RepID=UPI0020128583|nr:phosphopantetheine-binding protein [Argonema antarcticum]MCL1471392.1 phosphopantetheine-binding protein [Argonema antarcticum A004/B2]